jgi:sarcosine oxidase subunit beta
LILPQIVTHVRGNLTLKQQSIGGKVLVGGGWTGTGDEHTGERRLSRASIAGNAQAAVETVPALARAPLLRAWTGFEGRTPDKLPIIGPLPGYPNLHVLGCASGGLTLAPACGHLLAQQLAGEPLDLPLDAFAPARFAAAAQPAVVSAGQGVPPSGSTEASSLRPANRE